MTAMRRNRRALAEPLEQRVQLAAVPVGPEFVVHSLTAGNQQSPSVAMNAHGDFVIAWYSDGQDGEGNGIFARRYSAAGTPLGDEFRVNTYTTGDQQFPNVAMNTEGDFVIAWSGAGEGDDDGVYAQRYNAAGIAQGGQFRVNTFLNSFQRFPSVAIDADGDFVIVWKSLEQSGSGWGTYGQRYSASGVPEGAEFAVNVAGDLPDVAMDANGNFVVSLTALDGSFSGIYAQRYSASGVPQGAALRVNTHTAFDQWNSAVTMNDNGDFAIAWTSNAQDGSGYGVFAQRYDSAGMPRGGEFRANSYTTGDQQWPAIAMDADGGFVISWASSGQDGSGAGIFAQRYDPAGVRQGGEIRVNTYTPGHQFYPQVAMDHAGNSVFAWYTAVQAGAGLDVLAQRYAVEPEVNASIFRFEAAPHRIQFDFDRDVGGSLGIEDLLLRNVRTGQTIPAADIGVVYDPVTNTATYSYTGSAGGILGVLPDGEYRATLMSAGIMTPQGAPLGADHVFDFHFLQGDANRDGRVNLTDFNILAANFGQSGRDFTQGNFDYDPAGNVNLSDFNLLASRFGMAVAAPASSSPLTGVAGDEPSERSALLDELE